MRRFWLAPLLLTACVASAVPSGGDESARADAGTAPSEAGPHTDATVIVLPSTSSEGDRSRSEDLDGGPLPVSDAAPLVDGGPGVAIWARIIAPANIYGGQAVGVMSVARDAQDHIAISGTTGTAEGGPVPTIDFGLGTPSAKHAWIAVADAAGKWLWARFFDAVRGVPLVASAPNGNVTVVAEIDGTTDLGGASATGSSSLLVVSYDAAGTHRWHHVFTATGGPYPAIFPTTIATDGNTIAIGGEYFGNVDLGGGLSNEGYESGFVLALNDSGEHVWDRFVDAKTFSVSPLPGGGIAASVGNSSSVSSITAYGADGGTYWNHDGGSFTTAVKANANGDVFAWVLDDYLATPSTHVTRFAADGGFRWSAPAPVADVNYYLNGGPHTLGLADDAWSFYNRAINFAEATNVVRLDATGDAATTVIPPQKYGGYTGIVPTAGVHLSTGDLVIVGYSPGEIGLGGGIGVVTRLRPTF